MLEALKNINSVDMTFSGMKRFFFLVAVSFLLTACGGLVDLSSQSASTTISWEPMRVNGKDAETYRVLYSRPGERPKEVVTTDTKAELTASSLNGYTIYIEAYNDDRNSVFRLYNPS